MSEIMLDIETLSTSPNSLILTIGAIKFFRNQEIKDIKDMDTFYVRINQESCTKLNMEISKDTLEWWNSQSEESRFEAFICKDRINIKDALIKLSRFVKNSKCIWAHSPNFDCIILENAYRLCGIEIPWKFYNLRDTRTLYDLGNVTLENIDTNKHHSLYDCHNQIITLKRAFKNLKII
jgi:DNA polymerase III epsilon subunit-like protein